MAKITSSGPNPIPALEQILRNAQIDADVQAEVLERIQKQLESITGLELEKGALK